MRKLLGSAVALCAVLGLAAGARAADPDLNGMSSKARQGVADAEAKGGRALLDKLHRVNQMEMEMGNLALTQTRSDGVKDYARKLVSDHQKADEKVASLMKEEGFAPTQAPAPDGEMKHMDKLRSLTGTAFDRAFLTDMVSGHQKVMSMLDAARGSLKDDKLIGLIDDLTPQLKEHRDLAKKLLPSRNAARRARVP